MHPHLPQAFHEAFVHTLANRLLSRDPDAVLTEEDASRPFSIGVWIVRRIDALADRLASLRARPAGRPRAEPRTDIIDL